MSRKHNTKHERSPSKYKERLAARGLGRTPVMTYTGMSTAQITEAFARLPRYRWVEKSFVGEDGQKRYHQVRQEIG